MAKQSQWNDEYWLPLMQVYLKRPAGVKPLYSKAMVALALELHVEPKILYEQMFRLRRIDTPKIERLWATYGKNPRRLARGVKLIRQRNGFGQGDEFYEGVEMNETWERDFKPLSEDERLTPATLIVILDLYFRLTPQTMVPETPEVADLSRLLKLPASEICDIMNVFLHCDPCLKRDDILIHQLLSPCQSVWYRYGNGRPEALAALAAQLKEWFK